MKYFSLTLIIVGVLGFIEPASAQNLAGAAQCTGPTCSACNLVYLANAVIQWLIGFLTILFAVLMAVAGWGLVVSGGNQSALDAAKEKFTNAVIGFIIILAAWLVIDTIIRGLVGADGMIEGSTSGAFFWAEVQCQSQNQANQATAQGINLGQVDSALSGTDGVNPPNLQTGGGIVSVSPSGSTCFNGPDGAPGGGDDVCVATNAISGGSYNLPDGSGLGYAPPGGYIGPEVIEQNPQISPNLRLCDVTNCDSARRSGDYIYVDPYMVAQLDNVYNDLGGLSVNSGYRSPAYNQGVGGATHSRHQYGDAVDIAVTSSNTEARIIQSCRQRGATNIYTYDSGRHVHCDWRGAARQ